MVALDENASRLGEIDLVQELRALRETCDKIEQWLQILAEPHLTSSLEHLFPTSKHIHAFDLSDGVRSTREIGDLVGANTKTISDWWRKWEKLKIVTRAGRRGQFKKRYSLSQILIRYRTENPEGSEPEQAAKVTIRTRAL